MTRNPSILFVIGSMREGGAERQLLHLMRGLASRGWDVRLMLLRKEGGLLAELDSVGINPFIASIPALRPRWNPLSWLGVLASLWRTRRYIRDSSPDLVHAWLFWAHVWSWLALAGGGIPLVTGRRQMKSDRPAGVITALLERLINRRSVAIIANSTKVRDAALADDPGAARKCRVIYNGLDLAGIDSARPTNLRREFPGLSDAGIIFIHVAHLLPYKGHRDLLRAWKLVVGKYPGAKLLCVGKDEGLLARLEALRRRLGLDCHVVFAGSRTDVPALIKGADCCVHASRDEGLPNAVLEYMACGKPVVATRAGGTGEALGDAGWLVDIGPRPLAAGILAVLGDSTGAERKGREARLRAVAEFTIGKMLDEYIHAYQQIMRRRRK